MKKTNANLNVYLSSTTVLYLNNDSIILNLYSIYLFIIIEGAIPGAYQNICMSLPQRTITLKSISDEITIYQGMASIPTSTNSNNNNDSKCNDNNGNNSSVAGRTGVAIWNSGLLLTRLLDQINMSLQQRNQKETQTQSITQNNPLLFNGKTVLELGCGTGLVSVASSKLGANYVYATDGNKEVLELAKFNLEKNGIYPIDTNLTTNPNNGIEEGSNKHGEAMSLQWGSLDAIDYYDTADVIIGSDLTYNSGSWRVLVDTFASVLKPNGYVLYLTLGHSGFNVSGELNGFMTVVQSSGLLQVVDENNSNNDDWPFPGVGSLESLLSSSLSEKERSFISSTGGYRIIVLKRKQLKKMK